MTDLTNFTDTSDVSDAAIEWVMKASGIDAPAEETREDAKDHRMSAARTRILAARLIQQHRPDLLVDPVDAAVDAFMRECEFVEQCTREAAKRLYLMGIEKGKGA